MAAKRSYETPQILHSYFTPNQGLPEPLSHSSLKKRKQLSLRKRRRKQQPPPNTPTLLRMFEPSFRLERAVKRTNCESTSLNEYAALLDDQGKEEEATVYWKRAADKGNETAAREIAMRERDVHQAALWFQRAERKQGENKEDCLRLARECEEQQDLQEARKWFRKAAEQGCCESAYHLGRLNDEEALHWLQQSCERSHPLQLEAAHLLMIHLRKVGREEEAMQWLQFAAQGGHAQAALDLASTYSLGMLGNRINEHQATHWILQAVEYGCEEAVMEAAWRLRRGIGVNKDEDRALCLLKKKATPLALAHCADIWKDQDRIEESLLLWREIAHSKAPPVFALRMAKKGIASILKQRWKDHSVCTLMVLAARQAAKISIDSIVPQEVEQMIVEAQWVESM